MNLVIIGGGPAGLMAAEVASAAGAQVDLYDGMASVGRKFLLAGKGGLNLTHSESFEKFLVRYRARARQMKPLLQGLSPEALRAWVSQLGIQTFVGSSGRVFPMDLKAAPLLRAWLRRLRQKNVRFHVRHRWIGWDEEAALSFLTPNGLRSVRADAVVLALGGGSWPKLGSDGSWVSLLAERGVEIAPLRPTNCGFDIGWSPHFLAKFAGSPVKSIAISLHRNKATAVRSVGEFIITETGIEGGVLYGISAQVREEILLLGQATIHVDLSPDRDLSSIIRDLSQGRRKRTMASHLQRKINLYGVKVGLLREVLDGKSFTDLACLAKAIKSLPLQLVAPRPLEEAISTAGGVSFEALDTQLMIRVLPGVFCAGEMLDWEAPTGGYLLTACFATGHAAGAGSVAWLSEKLAAGT